MNGIEKIAYRNIYHAINYIVGGHYNTIQDNGDPKWLPDSMDALKEEIYDSAMNNLYAPGYEGYGKAPKEMRFSGEAFIRKNQRQRRGRHPEKNSCKRLCDVAEPVLAHQRDERIQPVYQPYGH